MNKPNTPTITWSDLAGFGGVKTDNLETAFGDNVGGAFFGVGKHKDVTINSVEPRLSKAGNQYLSLTFANEDGATIRSNVMLKDKEGQIHFTYRRLGAAVLSDLALRTQLFGETFRTNPALIESLRGLKVSITIAHGADGYLIEKNGVDGTYQLIDVETSKPFPEVANESFAGYTEAKERADELQLDRCYNEVKQVAKGSVDALAANEQAIQEALRTFAENAAGVTPIASNASVPSI